MNSTLIIEDSTRIEVKQPVTLVAIFLWIGFVCAISFMEAWLKFQAPGITLALGLGIGRLVFEALNKVEWVLALAILINLIFIKRKVDRKLVLTIIPILILLVQTAWLLPMLDIRAQQVIDQEVLAPSNIHFYYVGLEFIKVVALLILGISLFKKA